MNTASKTVATVAAVAALALGGSALANAAATKSTTASNAQAPAAGMQAPPAGMANGQQQPGGGPNGGQHPGETLVTGTLKATLTKAALAKVPGATVDKVETNADGGGDYEVHLTNASGARQTVLLDKDGTVRSVDSGMGPGGAPSSKQQNASNSTTNAG